MATMPNVVHPKTVSVNGHKIQVVAYCVMTDSQALQAAVVYCRTHKMPKPSPKKVLRILTLFDRESVGQLGP
jgi:uncharacterized membrane protein